jgi:NAD(P)-dependent dehydrogenase (short-subunit alcohol dehydrogenase family)
MSNTQTSLNGLVVAITGGARGIGLATASALAAAGAKVAIGDIDGDEAVRAAAKIGDAVLASELDVTDGGSFQSFLALIERELGQLDVLVNNAGIMPIGPMLEEPDAVARRVFDINVLGVMVGMKLALPGMLARGRGQIVNMSSVAGRSPVPGGASYAASKAAVFSLTETARVEYAGRGVSFTCVMPSFTATELIAGTKGVRFIPNVEASAVADAIVGAIELPKADVFVPSSVGAIIRTQPLIGRRMRDAINRLLGADRTFLNVDRGARASYDARISRPVGAESSVEPRESELPAA